MTKGRWFARALHVTVALSFILGALVVAPSVSADPGTSKWEKQGTPTEDDLVILPGSDITDFDVTGADGRAIYAIGTWYDVCNSMDYGWANVNGVSDLYNGWHRPKLWKSTDGGVTWSDKTSKVLDAKNLPSPSPDYDASDDWDDFVYFTAVSAAPDDPDFVIITGYDANEDPVVVGSNDGAGKFYYMGCGTVEGFITCVDVSMEVDDTHEIAVGTWTPLSELPTDYDTDDLGAIWRYTAGGYWSTNWIKTTPTSDDPAAGYGTGWQMCDAVVDLEFSPNFDVDDTLVALCVGDLPPDEPDSVATYWLQTGTWDSIDAWNSEAEFDGYPVLVRGVDTLFAAIFGSLHSVLDIGPLVRHLGDIDLPMDYMGDDTSGRKLMVAVNAIEGNPVSMSTVDDGGFLFWVENTTLSLEMLDHEDNPYIASIDYHGNVDMEGRTLVGLAFPSDWRMDELVDWYGGDGTDPALPHCAGIQVLRSETTDVCCPDWDWSAKPPSGQFCATVRMTPDGDWVYASTQGESRMFGDHWVGRWSDESAFSISGHAGELGSCWNQEGLIDTDIDFVADVAVTTDPGGSDQCSPSCSCLYIATVNVEVLDANPLFLYEEGKACGCDSIWRSCDGGTSWLRIWHKELEGDPMGGPEWMVLGLVPGENVPETIYMADLGTETVWVSNDGGSVCCPAGLGCWTDRNTGLDAIADMAVLDESTVYVVDFNGDMVKSTTTARHWSSATDTKVDDFAHDIICQGDWVLVAGDTGDVTYSDDGGDSFSELDDIGSGEVHVAFDSYFDDNGYVYAAVAGGDNGIYRTTIDGASFKGMNACDLDYYGIVVSDADGNSMTSTSTGGVLYASYFGSYNVTGCEVMSGVARLLNPAAQSCCGALSWDYLWDSLWARAAFVSQPIDIAICGDASDGASTIWAIDVLPYSNDSYYDGWDSCYTEFSTSDAGRLWKYNDVFAKGGPELIGVEDGATIPSDPCACVNEDFVLEWDRLCDACEYDIQIALDEGFKHIVYSTSTWANSDHLDCGDMVLEPCEDPMSFYKPSDPCVPSLVIGEGTLDCNQQYWWRVRARVAETDEIYRSWWSDKWSFTIAAGPGGAIQLTAPDDGASNVPLENIVFTWTAVADATSYEMILMDASGAEVASNSGDATSFVLGSKLDYDSAYMWQVNAMKGSNVLSESGTSTFRTMSKATPPPEIPETVINFPEPVTGTPTWVWVVIALAAILIIVVIVLIFRTRRV